MDNDKKRRLPYHLEAFFFLFIEECVKESQIFLRVMYVAKSASASRSDE